MTEVLNLQALRGIVGNSGDVYYAKGHTNLGDGGGGIFIWRIDLIFRASGIYSQDNNGTIVKVTGNDTGRWVRQYEGYINILYFGALGIGGDYTQNFQNAIDYAKLNSKDDPFLKTSTIFIPNGSYFISTVFLKNGVSIIGESMDRTIIYPTSGGLDGEYMFKMESGPVIINISNLNLAGLGATGQSTNRGAFLFEAFGQSEYPFHGGLWNSRITNINIYGFKGHGIYLKGGGSGSNYLLPNQFTVFENVRVFNTNDATVDIKNSLRMTGENGQITFLNCEFDGSFTKTSQDVYTFKKGKNVWIENDDKYQSAVISFINCTIQYADYGMYISWAENVTIDNCWFEMLGVAIIVKSNQIPSTGGVDPSKSINVVNNRFADAAGFGGRNVSSLPTPPNIKVGQCLNITNSFVNVNNNYVAITLPEIVGQPSYYNDNCRFIIAQNNTIGGVSAQGNSFQLEKLGITFGIYQLIRIQSDNSINCSGNKLIFIDQRVDPSTHQPAITLLKTINSSINAGELLTLRADQGNVTFQNTENIFFKPTSGNSFTIANGDIVTFIKIDNIITTNPTPPTPPKTYYSTYQLVSVMKNVV